MDAVPTRNCGVVEYLGLLRPGPGVESREVATKCFAAKCFRRICGFVKCLVARALGTGPWARIGKSRERRGRRRLRARRKLRRSR